MICPAKPIATASVSRLLPGPLLACLLLAAAPSADSRAAQQPPPATPVSAPATGPATPRQDLITIEGCLSGDTVTITKDDPSNLTHARTLRLTGTRAIRQRMRESRNQQVEVTGALVLGRHRTPPDRIETRARRKVGGKTTVYVAGASEQGRGSSAAETDSSFELDVVAIRALAPRCLQSGS